MQKNVFFHIFTFGHFFADIEASNILQNYVPKNGAFTKFLYQNVKKRYLSCIAENIIVFCKFVILYKFDCKFLYKI
jgi:hypothetical protein|tara:strand:- start:246 stop:473 length:228 start_codon:yes stop_codon:yes gene_type:complete